MRKLIFIYPVLILTLMGCQDFLERNPHDQISSATFWESREDFEMALTANYGLMHGINSGPWDNPPAGMWAYLMPNWDNLTDNSYGQHNYGGSQAIVSGDISSTSGGYISGVYQFSYRAIARANIFLDELYRYEGTDFPEEDKTRAEAEVRFLRAFYYFQLYFFYGDVPLITEPLTLENQAQPKAAAEQVFNQVIEDLDFAIQHLNPVPYYQNSGHATRSTAQTLKARALIYEAYDENGNPDPATLATVRDLCLDIMPLYSLSPRFEDLFQSAGQPGNPEIIFSVNYLAPDNAPPYGADIIYGDWLVVSPLQNFVDAFEAVDGQPWEESPLSNPDDPFENRDPRLEKTVFEDYVDWGEGNVHFPTNARPTGYGLKKFIEPGNVPYGYTILSDQNAVIFRLAEVLLMYAEAQNEIQGPDQSVYDAVNDIRDRVDMPPLPAGLSQDEMRERIRHERRIELAFEGVRYFDLKRWRIADEVLNNVTDGILNYNWEERFYHWPIPQSEIDRNQGVLEQNPDYS